MNVLTMMSRAVVIDKVDHLTLLHMIDGYEAEKHEHTDGSSRSLAFGFIRGCLLTEMVRRQEVVRQNERERKKENAV